MGSNHMGQAEFLGPCPQIRSDSQRAQTTLWAVRRVPDF